MIGSWFNLCSVERLGRWTLEVLAPLPLPLPLPLHYSSNYNDSPGSTTRRFFFSRACAVWGQLSASCPRLGAPFSASGVLSCFVARLRNHNHRGIQETGIRGVGVRVGVVVLVGLGWVRDH